MDKALVEGVLRLKPAERLRLVEVIYRASIGPTQRSMRSGMTDLIDLCVGPIEAL